MGRWANGFYGCKGEGQKKSESTSISTRNPETWIRLSSSKMELVQSWRFGHSGPPWGPPKISCLKNSGSTLVPGWALGSSCGNTISTPRIFLFVFELIFPNGKFVGHLKEPPAHHMQTLHPLNLKYFILHSKEGLLPQASLNLGTPCGEGGNSPITH